MGGGQSSKRGNDSKNVYKVNNEISASKIDKSNAASQENLIKAQLKARQKKLKDKKVRKVGIKGRTGLDISSTGSVVAVQHVVKSEETVKLIRDALTGHFLFHGCA